MLVHNRNEKLTRIQPNQKQNMNTENKTTQTPSAAADKTAHTPGPWTDTDRNDRPKTMDAYVKIDAERQGIAYVFGDTKSEREANARLIAAAPELLFACKRAIEEMHGEPREGWDAVQGCMDAIEKAEGAQ